jgi:hypothetical protein
MKNPYFSVFKRADRHYYSVAFKDKNGKYLPPVSTRQLTEPAAYQTAMDWLRDGIPAKRETLNVKQIELKELSKKIEAVKEAKIILEDLRRRGLVKSYVLHGTEQSQSFTVFYRISGHGKHRPIFKRNSASRTASINTIAKVKKTIA